MGKRSHIASTNCASGIDWCFNDRALTNGLLALATIANVGSAHPTIVRDRMPILPPNQVP
jgi:hypothetical protein